MAQSDVIKIYDQGEWIVIARGDWDKILTFLKSQGLRIERLDDRGEPAEILSADVVCGVGDA